MAVTRVAALYDIHGNLPALEAVIADLRRAEVDCIVIGGDVLPGPMPRETLSYLLDLNLPTEFIRGNGDRVVLEQMAGREAHEVPEPSREGIRWNAGQLAAEHERLIAGWPKTLQLNVNELGEVLFCHATPRNDTDVFTSLTPEDSLLPIFAEPDVPTVICGHTHMQFDRTIGNVRVVNAGSVGMPFGNPGAHWLLLGPDVQLHHTNYNLSEAAARIRATSYPQAHDFAARNVLQPPAEAAMLEAFAKVELK